MTKSLQNAPGGPGTTQETPDDTRKILGMVPGNLAGNLPGNIPESFLDPGPEVHVEACLQSFPNAHGEVPRKPFCGLRRPPYPQFNAGEVRMVWDG